MNTEQRNDLAALLMVLRNEGRTLLPTMVALHEDLCMQQRAALERVCKLEAELAELSAQDPREGGHFELHLRASVELSPRIRKWLKVIGGSYTECRGHHEVRFVKIPNLGDTFNTLGVAAELLNKNSLEWNGKRRASVCILRTGADVHMRETTWTVERLAEKMLAANKVALANRIREKRAALEDARRAL